MMTVRVTTPTRTKLKTFESLSEGNAWAQQVFAVLGRSKEFRPTKLAGGGQSIASPLTLLELHDKGISFFGAVDV